jgi:hypothetical protein
LGADDLRRIFSEAQDTGFEMANLLDLVKEYGLGNQTYRATGKTLGEVFPPREGKPSFPFDKVHHVEVGNGKLNIYNKQDFELKFKDHTLLFSKKIQCKVDRTGIVKIGKDQLEVDAGFWGEPDIKALTVDKDAEGRACLRVHVPGPDVMVPLDE